MYVVETTKFVDKVPQNYSLRITLFWLAKKVQLNAYYLCRKFKEITGKTIFAYLNEIRMESSLTLLKSTDMPIKRIAGECGFKNVYYFSYCFKKYFLMPPGKARKRGDG